MRRGSAGATPLPRRRRLCGRCGRRQRGAGDDGVRVRRVSIRLRGGVLQRGVVLLLLQIVPPRRRRSARCTLRWRLRRSRRHDGRRCGAHRSPGSGGLLTALDRSLEGGDERRQACVLGLLLFAALRRRGLGLALDPCGELSQKALVDAALGHPRDQCLQQTWRCVRRSEGPHDAGLQCGDEGHLHHRRQLADTDMEQQAARKIASGFDAGILVHQIDRMQQHLEEGVSALCLQVGFLSQAPEQDPCDLLQVITRRQRLREHNSRQRAVRDLRVAASPQHRAHEGGEPHALGVGERAATRVTATGADQRLLKAREQLRERRGLLRITQRRHALEAARVRRHRVRIGEELAEVAAESLRELVVQPQKRRLLAVRGLTSARGLGEADGIRPSRQHGDRGGEGGRAHLRHGVGLKKGGDDLAEVLRCRRHQLQLLPVDGVVHHAMR
mmetsp:Transcript_97583/g.281584  ORF Transcript_97583/g.281584 Transcript_97583/m.281584 type:complete len:443 (+) Transcript_97583:131-1459(+)